MKGLSLLAAATVIAQACSNTAQNTNVKPVNDSIMPDKIVVADYATDPTIERGTKLFLKALNSPGGKPMEQMQASEARKVLEGAQSSVAVDVSGIEETEKSITEDGITVKIVIVRPSGAKGKLPGFMFFHGGGWVLGDYPTHKRLIRDLVVYSKATAIYVDYTRSPESKYPLAINQSYAATKWVAAHGSEINVDREKLAVVGNSVGGNMAAVIALMAKDKKGPKLKFQLLFWPVTNADFETASYNKYATERFLTKNMMIWFWDNYMERSDQRNEIYASPLKASLEQLKGLPPALVQTAENDVLRDEGEAYARKMDESGNDVTLMRVEGMIHDYGLLNPIAKVPAVQSALRAAAAELKYQLNK